MIGRFQMPKPSYTITIFGGTGDLTYRKLLPAFYNLKNTQLLPESFQIVVIGRREFTSETYREHVKDWILKYSRLHQEDEHLITFLNHIHYFKMTFTEDEGYVRLREYYSTLLSETKHLYYFAVAPSFFVTIADQLSKYDLVKNSKVIIEKPFGNDLKSSIEINTRLNELFTEDNIYRIDHYVAKEMVQNISTIRFTNELFKNIWNHNSIENIQISANEIVGVEGRGGYYDTTGALKDMFQNHILQILSIVTMNEPDYQNSTSIHTQQERILNHLYIENYASDVVFGQYTENDDSLAYRDEPSVSKDSNTETFVALKLGINLPEWYGTPIYVRTGKRMHERDTRISIVFKSESGQLQNVLIIKIQPEEGVYLQFNIKKPGQTYETQTVTMDFCQSCDYMNRINTPEAYERLLNAAMNGDHSLFTSFKQVETSWSFVEKILEHASKTVHPYKAFTPGPQSSHDLLSNNGHFWIENLK